MYSCPPIEWTPAFSFGLADMDAEHAEIFRRFDRFRQTCLENRGEEEIEDMILFLQRHALEHFTSEEALMVRFGFPEAAQHQEMHKVFVKELDVLWNRFMEGKAVGACLHEINRLVNWFVVHITIEDPKFMDYLPDALRTE